MNWLSRSNQWLNHRWLKRSSWFNSPYLLLVLTVLFWAGNAIVGRAVHSQIPPVSLAFWRWSLAGFLILIPAWRHLKRDWQQILAHWQILLLLSALGIALFNTLLYQGLQFTTAINAILMQSAMPLVVVLLSYSLFQEKLTCKQAIGVGISFMGAVAIVAHGDWQQLVTLSFNQGDLLILIGVVGYAGYTALLRLRPKLHPLSFLAVTFILGSFLLLPFYLGEIATGQFTPLTSTTILSIGYVAIFPSILAYLCYNRGVELIGANQAGLFIHLVPVFGSVMAMLFLGEKLYWFHAIGFSLILSGITLVTRQPDQGLGALKNAK
ncbi:DMT family transporter [Pantanalinema sp. GBBB05]|uniref:DMT family transporter n=1 Tax=Pantanalinema sp. GBBB05 TaxID=2604139 RepID=UPI001DC8C20A|nr:DMT family transporter [Pantanalinema sp. GBBB05]